MLFIAGNCIQTIAITITIVHITYFSNNFTDGIAELSLKVYYTCDEKFAQLVYFR